MDSKIFSDILEITDRRRQYIIRISIAIIILLLIMSTIFLVKYNRSDKTEYINYKESSNVDYHVYLHENDFFTEDYLSTNKKYIASLIKNIQADFKYDLDILEKKKEYKYSYKIESQVNVVDKNDKRVIYSDISNLVLSEELSTVKNNINIDEKVEIDYNKYNNLISKFVSTYNLNEAESTLLINMYVKIANITDDLSNADEMQVATLEIPLTRNTVGIELITNNANSQKSNIFIKSTGKKLSLLALSALTFFLCASVTSILIVYYLKTRTDENIFDGKLSRIIHTYKGYIQKVDSEELNFSEYQSVYVDSFNDLLEIRDTLQEPILMLQNKQNTEVHFLIPSQTRIVYIFLLSVGDNIKRLAEGKQAAITDKVD